MKGKFLTTMAIFFSLALTACGGGGKWESNASKHWHNKNGQKVDEAAHVFKEDKSQAVAATCAKEGKKVEICSVCGYKKESKVSKLDHTWNDGVASGKCGEAGSITYTCTACGDTNTETTGLIPHNWDLANAQTVPSSNGGVEYTTAECKTCHAKGYFIASTKADITYSTTTDTELKTAPEGCAKLPKNNDFMTVSFYLDAAKEGVFWLRGAMDYWYEESNNNQNKTYYSQNSGNTDVSTKTGNFKLEVGPDVDHLTNVELPDNTDLTFGDMLPETVASNEGGHQWSVIGDCIVGSASLAAGLNTIKFTRVDSYNLAVHDFLFVVPAAA